jgi:hypothetical protein
MTLGKILGKGLDVTFAIYDFFRGRTVDEAFEEFRAKYMKEETVNDLFDYDFLEAMNESLVAAEECENSHQEIWEIIARLTDDAKDATDGQAFFGLDVPDTRDLVDQDGHEARLVVRSIGVGEVYESEVGKFASTDFGYPVTIEFGEYAWTVTTAMNCAPSSTTCAVKLGLAKCYVSRWHAQKRRERNPPESVSKRQSDYGYAR